MWLWLFPRVAAQPGESRAGSGLGGMPSIPLPGNRGVWGVVCCTSTHVPSQSHTKERGLMCFLHQIKAQGGGCSLELWARHSE